MEPLEFQGSYEQFLCEKAAMSHTPINAILELTPLCNMNCDMCFVRLSPEEMKQRGQLRTTEEWISLGSEMYSAGTLFVLLTGGEPLLHPGFREIYSALKKMGMILTVNTNGTLIDEEWADFFAKHIPRRINITLYGKDENTYKTLCHYQEGYQKTLRAIKLLLERGIDVKINGSITPLNVSDLEGMLSIMDDMQATWKFDTYMYPASRERSHSFSQNSRLTSEQAAEVRVRLLKKRAGDEKNFYDFARNFIKKGNAEPEPSDDLSVKCRAGQSSFVINWQGKMRPCVMLPVPEESVFEADFSEAWRKLVEEVSQIRLSSRCSACARRNVCQTCAACAFLESGSYDGVPEYMCRYTEETLRLLKKSLEEEQERGNG